MALQPSLKPLLIAGRPDAPHTLDFFVDYVCPFSAKLAFTIDNVLKPLLDTGGQYDGKVKAIIRLQVQPWHSSSTLTHESALAVARVAPEKFWSYSVELFRNQSDFFDIPTADLSPTQIRDKLVELAITVVGADKKDALKDLLSFKSSLNGGTAVTDDLKYTVKFSRQNSIHVTPTVLWDGLIAGEISSSWGEREWSIFLKAKVAV
ncbi:hypothetical protein M0805_006104 [Coniferiporia weirii]|nr:hypothetical protein M0805_006104 [Coniferiporia weirii]